MSSFGFLLATSFWYFAATLLTRIGYLVLLPLYSYLFTPEQFGEINTVKSAMTLIGSIAILSLSSAYSRYFQDYKQNPSALRSLFSSLTIFIFGWGTLVTLIYVFAFERLNFIDNISYSVLLMAGFGAFLTEINNFFSMHFKVKFKSRLIFALALVYFVFSNGFILLLLYTHKQHSFDYFAGQFLANLLVFVLFVGVYIPREKIFGLEVDKHKLKESLLFALPLTPGILANWINSLSDRVLLTYFGYVAQTGIYSVAANIAQGVYLLSDAVTQAQTPAGLSRLLEDFKQGEAEIFTFLHRFTLILALSTVCLSLFCEELIALLFSKEYAMAFQVVPILAFAYIFGGIYRCFHPFTYYFKQNWISSTGAVVAALLNAGLNILLIPKYGQFASAFTTLLSVMIYMFWLIFWLARLNKLKFPLGPTYRIVSVGAATIGLYYGIFYFFPMPISAAKIAIKLSLLAAFLISFLWTGELKDLYLELRNSRRKV